MSAGRNRLVRLVAVGVLPAMLAFVVVHALRAGDGEDHRGRSSGGGDVDATGPAEALDLTATLVGTRYQREPTFQVRQERAAVSPPPEVRDCRQFAAWAQREGGVPAGPDPVHILSLHARRSVDVQFIGVVAVPVAQPSLDTQGPWVELACRDAAPAATGPPAATSSPAATSFPADDGPAYVGAQRHVLTAGQAVELPVDLDPPSGPDRAFPPGIADYYLQVRMEVDGVEQTRELRNGTGYFRCCGRTTFMGFQAARYEWTLSPARVLRYCAELRYVDRPPPRTCAPREPA
ncbi:hypothetical protein C5N14_10180 [Micromonospora sp. MW-13]|uniref:hypothetical protein n=1 Tax=Micromonospora sp. MW-13 TaxID=2094022 RepID=UPI000EC2558B|nr:hypothetical protein [Micromonospora sp. MW-13]RGC69123.1 hypothetical protein C5N14_10180 [Micromonospora sp. MW-13]